jgi:hypothetical protein
MLSYTQPFIFQTREICILKFKKFRIEILEISSDV